MSPIDEVKRRTWPAEFPGLDLDLFSKSIEGEVRPADREVLGLRLSHERHGSLSVIAIHLLGESGLIKKIGIATITFSVPELSWSWPWIRWVEVAGESRTNESVCDAFLNDPRTKDTKWIAVWQGYHSYPRYLTIYRIPRRHKDASKWVEVFMTEELKVISEVNA